MVKQIEYIKSNLMYPEGLHIEDTYVVVIKRTNKDDRVESLNKSLKEFAK